MIKITKPGNAILSEDLEYAGICPKCQGCVEFNNSDLGINTFLPCPTLGCVDGFIGPVLRSEFNAKYHHILPNHEQNELNSAIIHLLKPSLRQNESAPPDSGKPLEGKGTATGKDASLTPSAGSCWSLLQLVDGLSCPDAKSLPLELLAKTPLEAEHLEALASLWRSLGRPTSGFWQKTIVYYIRIRDFQG